MCGIAGYVGPAHVEQERIVRTLAVMRHRGPDNAAHRRFLTPDGRHVLFVHTRLNIIDLDPRANQPMQVGGSWIVFNGELYNYVELREEMARSGAEFETESDTEVLLTAIERYGCDAMQRCEGMWAFATFSERDGSVTLCRDRFGEKPLYLYRDDEEGLYFASEVKAIVELLGRPLSINDRHVHRFLVNGYKALHKTEETFFERLTRLPQGKLMTIGPGGSTALSSYWAPSRACDDSLTYEEVVEETRARVIRAVEIRLRADVPLAFCMSGGVDSISLISIAKNLFDYDVHGFTIMNSDARYEEQDMIDYAVEELGIRHTAIPVDTSHFLDKLRTLVRHHDAPVSTITYVAHWLLMESIAEHGYRISVSGTGADELFSGYYDHHLAYLYEVRTHPELAGRSLAAWQAHVAPLVRNPFLKNPNYFVEDPSRREHIYLDADDFAAALRVPFSDEFTEENYSDDLLRNRMLNELFHESVPVILHEDDLNAMFFSIENRSPFLDRALFEYSSSIPTPHLIKDGKAKSVLRDAMRGIAPARVLDNRRKVGFNAPILSFLAVDDPTVRGYLLDDSPVFDHVRREGIEEVLEMEFLPNSKSKFLFNFINAKMFLEEFSR